MSEKIGSFSRRLWHSANTTNTPGEVIAFGGSSNFFKNPSGTIETNKVVIFCFAPPKLQTLCIDNLLGILKDDSADKWMPDIIRLPRGLIYDISRRIPFQNKYAQINKREEIATFRCFFVHKILHRKFWRF